MTSEIQGLATSDIKGLVPPAAVSSEKPIYRLGKVFFQIRNCKTEYEELLDRLLPRASASSLARDPNIQEINTGCSFGVRELINHVLHKHRKCIWADAACLVAPSGAKFLLTGRSSAGKSTTTLAMALAHGWKTVAEDITLFDRSTGEILSFPTPFSLKAGTADLLEKTIGKRPSPIIDDEWVPMQSLSMDDNVKGPADFAIHLIREDAGPITREEISPSDYLRYIMPNSNVLRMPDGIEQFLSNVREGGCFVIRNGSLSERMDALLQLAGMARQ